MASSHDQIDNEAILLLTGETEHLTSLVEAIRAAEADFVDACAMPAEAIMRTRRIVGIVATGAGLRAVDFDALLTALAEQPAWLNMMVIAVGVDEPGDIERLTRLDMHVSVVPVDAQPDHRLLVSLVRTAIRGHRNSRHYSESCEQTQQAAHKLAESFEARVEKRTEELATALTICSIASEKLTETAERNRAVIEMSDLMLFTADAKGTMLRVDDRFFEITGFPRDAEMSISSDKLRIHPDDRERVRAAQVEAIRTGKTATYEYRGIVADGTYRWWQLRAGPVFDPKGAILRWNGTMVDVHDRKVAEDRLRNSELRHRASIALSNLVTFTLTGEGRLAYIDDHISTLIGRPSPELLAGAPDSICHPDDVAALVRLRDEAKISRRFDLTSRLCHGDGTYRWWRTRAAPRCAADDTIIGWYGTMEDVDDLRQSEERLRASEDRHRFCIGLSKLITYTATATGKILSIDDSIHALTGVSPDEIVGGSPLRGCHPDDIAGLQAAHLASVNGDFDHSYRIQDADGGYRWWRSRSRPRCDDAGNITIRYGTLESIDDLRRAEERLRDSEELHRHSLELSNLIVWTADRKGRFQSISPRIFKAIGLTREIMPTLRPISLVHEDDLAVAAAALQSSLGEGKSADIRLRLRVAGGSFRWWRVRSSPLRDAEGAIIRWYGTMEDVDELTRAEERLRDSEELHRFSVELGNQVVWTGTPEGDLLSIGPDMLEKIGFGAEPMLWSGPEQLVHPDDWATAAEGRRTALCNGSPADFEIRLLHRDGAYHWWRVRAAPLRAADDTIIRWYGTLEDIDQLHAAVERLRETEALYRYTVELGEAIVITASVDGKITSIGPRWAASTGVKAEDMLGGGVFDFIHPEDRAEATKVWARHVTDGTGLDHVCRIANAAGQYRWWRSRMAQRRDDTGGPIGWYGTLEDVDAVTRAELQLKHLQTEMVHLSRLNAMGTMASTLAHELNQPLAAVINYIAGCRRLLAGLPGPAAERIETAMRSAQDCAVRAGEIIRRVRQLVSHSETSHAPISVSALINDACDIALLNAHELGIDVVVDLDPRVAIVHVDNIQVQQLLINLIRNAAEAVTDCDARKIIISTRPVDGYCALSVEDNGPGVSDAILDRLFEPFETSKPTGMGIGLSISRTIAESHGGKIEHTRSALGGACFTVLLPVHQPGS